MCPTSISVWFVCKLCRSSFRQIDDFIEHKIEEHFTEFENTNCIIFEEIEQSLLYPVATNHLDPHLADERNEPLIKVEVNDDDATIPFNSSEIIDEPNLDLVEPKTEPITYEIELDPDDESHFFDVEQPEQNPHVPIKRLTTEEIQRAFVPRIFSKNHSRLLKCQPKTFANCLEPPSSLVADSTTNDDHKVEKSSENQPPATVEHFHIERYLQFKCKLCSTQLESDAELKTHVGICALYHEDRNRFCGVCNRKFSTTENSKRHRLRFHGTEEEKLSLYEFKCHLCPKQYQAFSDLRFHLESHNEERQQLETSKSNSLKCSNPNCGKVFRCNAVLQKHIAAVHFGLRPFSCPFPNCNRKFTQKVHMEKHFRTHIGERPYKCTVDTCNEAFTTFYSRSVHHRNVHLNF